MSRLASPRLRAYCTLSAALLVAALASGRPELVALAAPFLAFLAIALARSSEPVLSVSVAVARERVLEGDQVSVSVVVSADGSVPEVEVALSLTARCGCGGSAACMALSPRRRRAADVRAGRYGPTLGNVPAR